MVDSINGSDHGILKWDTPTRVPPNAEPSSPDVLLLKKANWDIYRQEVEAALSKRSLPTDCQRDEKILRTILLKATSHHFHTGRHEEPVSSSDTGRDDQMRQPPQKRPHLV